MIQSDFKFWEQVDPYEYLQGFTYVVEMNRFKWDSRATADKVKMILNGALCSVEGWTGEPFKINETENEVYWEKHWRTLQRGKLVNYLDTFYLFILIFRIFN